MLAASVRRCSRYIPVVGRSFLVETLYGSKYSPHIGTYHMPYLYVKTLLLCATGKGLAEMERRHVHGLVEALLPSNMSEDNLTKLELMQFVDSVPTGIPVDAMAQEGPSETGTAEEDAAPCAVENEHHMNLHVVPNDRGNASGHAKGMRSGGGGTDLAAAVSFMSAAAFPSHIARILMYDAVTTCLADGVYSAEERERVALVAAQIGLSSAVREEIERLATQERVIAIRKRKLLKLPTASALASPRSEEGKGRPQRRPRSRVGRLAAEHSRDGPASEEHVVEGGPERLVFRARSRTAPHDDAADARDYVYGDRHVTKEGPEDDDPCSSSEVSSTASATRATRAAAHASADSLPSDAQRVGWAEPAKLQEAKALLRAVRAGHTAVAPTAATRSSSSSAV